MRYSTLLLDAAIERPFPGGREERRLADPCLAANDERAAAPVDPTDQVIKLSQLVLSAEQLGDSRISARGGQRPSRLLHDNATRQHVAHALASGVGLSETTYVALGWARADAGKAGIGAEAQ